MKRIHVYIDQAVDEALSETTLREHRSKASRIREAVERQYGAPADEDLFDAWAEGVEGTPGDIDDVVYGG